MSRCLLLLLLLLTGCGPMQKPMVNRLDTSAQKDFDDAWNKAAYPVERLNHQQWLDLIVGVQLFQIGVDRLSFHSEKQLTDGHVEMEVTFDRAHPEQDRFTVKFFNQTGKFSRQLHYNRDEVEKTYNDLFVNMPSKETKDASEDTLRRQKEFESRWTAIFEFFPKAKENK